MSLSNSRNFYVTVHVDKAIWVLETSTFSEKIGSSVISTEILAFGSHCSAKFQPILDYFIPNFKFKYEDSENIKEDRVNTVVFNLHKIKGRAFFLWDTRYNFVS